MKKNTIASRILAAMTGAVVFAGAMVAGVTSPAQQVEASDISTQALRSAFDANFYANKYADVKKAYGTDQTALFNHFLQHGMTEGRMMNSSFDPKIYLQNYSDVNSYCGGNYAKAYEHYLNYGKAENRNAATYNAIATAVAANAAASQYSGEWWKNYGDAWWNPYCGGDYTWIWTYYDIYGHFPDWINYEDNAAWDNILLEAYIDHYGTLPGQPKYNGWDWSNAYWRVYGDSDYNPWSWDWSNPWLYGSDDEDDDSWNWWNTGWGGYGYNPYSCNYWSL